jgi:hypothetical protein
MKLAIGALVLACGVSGMSGCHGSAKSARLEQSGEARTASTMRSDVESRLGCPVESMTLGDGARVDMYGMGGPSTMQVLTLGHWTSDPGTLCELTPGQRVAIAYDRQGHVVAVNLGTPASGTTMAGAPDGDQ